ncbi:hypothetical protein PGB90_009950 [Kerria lacca]
MSLAINFFEKYLPTIIVQTFKFGKFSYIGKKFFISYFEVPKSWFRHFYICATLYSMIMMYLVINKYILNKPVPEIFSYIFDIVTTPNRTPTISATTAVLALVLLCLQIWRRLYETVYVSVFSDTKINIIHYFVGILHYIGALTAIVVEAQGFADLSLKYKKTFSITDIGLRQIMGVVIFFWAWYNQYKTAVILANLRKDNNGNVVSYNYKLPVGYLFDTLSSPHMFCEMLIYLALNLILWGHTIWPYIFLWVFCNQCETALLNHWWYKSTFKVYPKKRKAYLPFIL